MSAISLVSAASTRAHARVGRNSKLTPQLQRKFARMIERGVPFRSACDVCGIGERTGYDWMCRGERGERPYVAFLNAIVRARARCVVALVKLATVDGAAGARWILERRFPEHFALKTRVEHL